MVSDSIIPHLTALIKITQKICKALDEGNIGRGDFVDLQKAFDIVDHQTLLAKLSHYMIHYEFQMTGLNQICLIAISLYP